MRRSPDHGKYTLQHVVTSTQNVQQTPIAITAYDAAMLEARGKVAIAHATNFAPNVQLSNAVTGFGQMSAIFIRGVGQADPHFAVEPGVGMRAFGGRRRAWCRS